MRRKGRRRQSFSRPIEEQARLETEKGLPEREQFEKGMSSAELAVNIVDPRASKLHDEMNSLKAEKTALLGEGLESIIVDRCCAAVLISKVKQSKAPQPLGNFSTCL